MTPCCKKQNAYKTQLLKFAQLHPLAQPQDFIKRLYHAQFGGGHLIADAEKSLAYLTEEIGTLTPEQTAQPIFEELEGDFCWMNLSATRELPAERLNRIFVASAAEVSPEAKGSFTENVALLQQLCEEHCELFAFSKEELAEYLQRFSAEGMPLLRHSEVYRKAYSPAYRVVRKEYAQLWPLLVQMEQLLRKSGQVCLAIDGDSASGKTSLAKRLAQIYDCNVFHADDFFLPQELRTEERLREPGGNFHRERFEQEICRKMKQKEPFVYRAFSCSSMQLGDPIPVQPKAVVICEGSYTMHPQLRQYYDLSVFLSIDPQTQQQRILQRNGEERLSQYLQRWIPMEKRYHEALQVQEACTLVLKNKE